MSYENAEGTWLNYMLRKKVFNDGIVSTQEHKDATGLEIKELVMCWLFEHNNNFKAAIREWKKNGAPLDYREIQGA